VQQLSDSWPQRREISRGRCAYVLVALLHRSHGATVDLESKGAGVTRGVVKAWVHSLLSVTASSSLIRA
jgi:hypothetical protein